MWNNRIWPLWPLQSGSRSLIVRCVCHHWSQGSVLSHVPSTVASIHAQRRIAAIQSVGKGTNLIFLQARAHLGRCPVEAAL